MKSKVLGMLAVGFLAAFATSSEAYVVSISGTGSYDGNWNVTTVNGVGSDLGSTLSPQVWYGNAGLASTFASALQGSLGYPNFSGGSGNAAPFFAYLINSNGFAAQAFYQNSQSVSGLSGNGTYVFAVASRVPEPGTLALLGLGLAGLGLSRRRKAN